jgi:hypothetical protein
MKDLAKIIGAVAAFDLLFWLIGTVLIHWAGHR